MSLQVVVVNKTHTNKYLLDRDFGLDPTTYFGGRVNNNTQNIPPKNTNDCIMYVHKTI